MNVQFSAVCELMARGKDDDDSSDIKGHFLQIQLAVTQFRE